MITSPLTNFSPKRRPIRLTMRLQWLHDDVIAWDCSRFQPWFIKNRGFSLIFTNPWQRKYTIKKLETSACPLMNALSGRLLLRESCVRNRLRDIARERGCKRGCMHRNSGRCWFSDDRPKCCEWVLVSETLCEERKGLIIGQAAEERPRNESWWAETLRNIEQTNSFLTAANFLTGHPPFCPTD